MSETALNDDHNHRELFSDPNALSAVSATQFFQNLINKPHDTHKALMRLSDPFESTHSAQFTQSTLNYPLCDEVENRQAVDRYDIDQSVVVVERSVKEQKTLETTKLNPSQTKSTLPQTKSTHHSTSHPNYAGASPSVIMDQEMVGVEVVTALFNQILHPTSPLIESQSTLPPTSAPPPLLLSYQKLVDFVAALQTERDDLSPNTKPPHEARNDFHSAHTNDSNLADQSKTKMEHSKLEAEVERLRSHLISIHEQHAEEVTCLQEEAAKSQQDFLKTRGDYQKIAGKVRDVEAENATLQEHHRHLLERCQHLTSTTATLESIIEEYEAGKHSSPFRQCHCELISETAGH